VGELVRQYEVVALLELLIARLQEPRFGRLTGADDLVVDLQRLHGELSAEIGAGESRTV